METVENPLLSSSILVNTDGQAGGWWWWSYYEARVWRVYSVCAFVRQRVRQCNWLLAFCTSSPCGVESTVFLHVPFYLSAQRRHCVSPFLFLCLLQRCPFLPFEPTYSLFTCVPPKTLSRELCSSWLIAKMSTTHNFSL